MKKTLPYTKKEQRAEREIDQFLKRNGAFPTLQADANVLQELRELAHS